MKVGVLYEFSGTVRDAFLARGHDAVSCDRLPTDSPGPHIRGDVWDQDWTGFDLLICHPPCTYLANSGVRWLHTQPGRWAVMRYAASRFRDLFDLPCEFIGVENPVMHKHALQIVGRKHDQTIQPFEYGHPESKRTCLWLKGLPCLTPTKVLTRPKGGVWDNQTPSGQNKLGPSADRWKLRSKTYDGIAAAMAEQWGCLA